MRDKIKRSVKVNKCNHVILGVLLLSWIGVANAGAEPEKSAADYSSVPVLTSSVPKLMDIKVDETDGKSVEGIWIAIQKIDNVLERMADGNSKDALKESRDKIYGNLTSIIDYEGQDPYPCDTLPYKPETLDNRYEAVSKRYKVSTDDMDYKQIRKDKAVIKTFCEKSYGVFDKAVNEYIKNNQ